MKFRLVLSFNATFEKSPFSCHAILDKLHSQSLTVKGGKQAARILKAKGQNQTRPARYFVRNPPQFSGKCRLCPAGAAMNFIADVGLRTKKNPAAERQQGQLAWIEN